MSATPFDLPTALSAAEPVRADATSVACSSCNLRELCLPVGLSAADLDRLDAVIAKRRPIAQGEALFRSGEPFRAIYAVRTGFFKTCIVGRDGREQVTGFQMAGELLGLDGIGNDRHACDAIALEDSRVCVIPFAALEALSRDSVDLQHQVHRIMSREIVRDQGVMLLLGSMRAEERVAHFLLNLSQRLQARGFSSSAFILRARREEIGSYLGLKLETVSRVFSRLHDEGMLDVDKRHIRILDEAALRRLVGPRL